MRKQGGCKMSEDKIDISKLDLTVQTVSLGPESGPVVSLMKGHVDAKTFVKAFHEEGWNNTGEPLTEEQIEIDAKNETEELVHTYGIFFKNKWKWNVGKGDVGAEPVTIRNW